MSFDAQQKRESNRRHRIRRNGCAPVPRNHRPFSLDPLLARLDSIRPKGLRPGLPTVAWENAQLCLDRGQRRRYERLGMTPYSADLVATRLGLHPAEVWGNAWWQDALAFAVDESA